MSYLNPRPGEYVDEARQMDIDWEARQELLSGETPLCPACDSIVDIDGLTVGECPGGSGVRCEECFACSCDGSC